MPTETTEVSDLRLSLDLPSKLPVTEPTLQGLEALLQSLPGLKSSAKPTEAEQQATIPTQRGCAPPAGGGFKLQASP